MRLPGIEFPKPFLFGLKDFFFCEKKKGFPGSRPFSNSSFLFWSSFFLLQKKKGRLGRSYHTTGPQPHYFNSG